MRNVHLTTALTILLSAMSVFAQDPAKWSLSTDQAGVLKTGQKMSVELKAAIEPGWHLYALEQPKGGPISTTIKPADEKVFKLDGNITSPNPKVAFDPNFKIETKFFETAVVFGVPITMTTDASLDQIALDVRYQLCNDTSCLPPRTKRVSPAGETDVKKSVLNEIPADAGPSIDADSQAGKSNYSQTGQQQQGDLWGFIWIAATLGALSLLTPCVFPMIPITVSYFTNHSGGHRSKALRLASIYSIGIIGTFTLLGMVLAIFVGAAGINLFAANPWVNLLITAIFLFFAFNLFGAYEITIPTNILTKLDRITRSHEGEGSGIIGALLMGLTFTLTSFTCTSPFVGTILVSASQGEWQRPLVGMLAFSIVFAMPFFVLALVPQWVSQIPRAGGWMNSIKVAMGFLEVAAAMKFLSNADLVWKWGIFTRDVVLAVWIAVGIILAAYLLGKFQLSHDSKPERIGAFRLVSAIVSLAISFYLVTGLFGAKLGELEAFLPPAVESASLGPQNGSEEGKAWITNNYDAALARARSENKLVFIDFTGYTCTNCRWMEANIFPKPAVVEQLNKFVLVRLYTDGDGAIYEQHQNMEQEKFGTVALPFYAVVDGDGRTVATFPGLTRSEEEFTGFLRSANP